MDAMLTGLTNLLITCDTDNTGPRRVIEGNGGILEGIVDGVAPPRRRVARYWVSARRTTTEAPA
jgi:predicted acetyltransferase